jgi:hypothetical protein
LKSVRSAQLPGRFRLEENMNDLIGSVAVGIYTAITDALGPELTRRANASLREALTEGLFDPRSASILATLCHDEDDDAPIVFIVPALDSRTPDPAPIGWLPQVLSTSIP